MNDVILELVNITKSFGDTQVLNGINLTVRRGEFITLLGSSGCGKTTALRIISGLESPDSGQVLLEQKDVTAAEPNKRDVNTVFQNYALFPHMSVGDNIGYSLRLRREKKAAIRAAVSDALALVQLPGYEKRMPHELSGGQRQRVAIARAIVNKPKILLLDEPLGALDLQLRRQMQIELKRLQKQLGITFIYITHDQEEALNMSDRIAVMRDGAFEQIGTPADIYDAPQTGFVAKFVGDANIITGKAERADGIAELADGTDGVWHLRHAHGVVPAMARGAAVTAGEAITLAIHSEQILMEPIGEERPALGLVGTVVEKTFATGKTDEKNPTMGLVGTVVEKTFATGKTDEKNPTMGLVGTVVEKTFATGKTDENTPPLGLVGTVVEKTFAGGMLRIAVAIDEDSEVIVSRHGINSDLQPGDMVMLHWPAESAVLVRATPTSEGAL